MEAAEVSTKVRQVLNEAGSGAKSPRDQVLRKLAMAEWMTQLEGRRVLKKKESPTLVDDLRTAVIAKRQELGTTAEDIRLMEIPVLTRKREGKVDYFPHYSDLPGFLVREKIIGFLTNPLDKLNLFRVIPSEGEIMEYWDAVHLQFEAIFPILMKQEELMDWKVTYNLSKVDKFFRRVVVSHFKNRLSGLDYISSNGAGEWEWDVAPNEILPFLESNADSEDEWCCHNPLTIKVRLNFNRSTSESTDEENMEFLRKHGEKVLDCNLELEEVSEEDDETTNKETAQRLLKTLNNILSMMPNLINLEVDLNDVALDGDGDGGPISEKVTRLWASIQDAQLPDLKSLKSMNLLSYDSDAAINETLKRKLLVKYNQRLKKLVIDCCNKLYDFNLPFPNLSQLSLSINSRRNSQNANLVEDLHPFFHMFLRSPLKVLYLQTNRLMRGASSDVFMRAHIPGILTLLSNHFGNTLEELDLFLWRMNSYYAILHPAPIMSPMWMLGCEFPKVKKLSMTFLPHPDDSGFLLLFPALEKFSMVPTDDPEPDFWARDQIVEVSPDLERLKESNIWKLLPNLTDFVVDGENCLTRKECIIHQQHQMSMVVPTAEQLEKQWEVTKMVFPILLKQDALKSWKVRYNLSRVHPYFRDLVIPHFNAQLRHSKHLKDLPYNSKRVGVNSLRAISNTKSDTKWCSLNPIPITVSLNLSAGTERVLQDMRFLYQLGHRFWACRLGIPGAVKGKPYVLRNMLNDSLNLMPNLVSLVISSSSYDDPGISNSHKRKIEESWNGIKDAKLPDLPKLRILGIAGGHCTKMEPIKRLLLIKYGQQLESLVLEPWYPFDNTDFAPRFPTLKNLKLGLASAEEIRDVNHVPDPLPFFGLFSDCPLRFLNLDLKSWGKKTDVFKRVFPAALFPLISNYFGDTLEEMNVEVVTDDTYSLNQAEPCDPPDPSKWMENCAFPKLTKFSLDRYPHPDDTVFLKCFPNLETLCLNWENTDWPEEEVYQRKQTVELSYEKEKMKCSNIWEILPRLNVIKMGEWKLTRNERNLFQENKMELGVDCGADVKYEWTDDGRKDFEIPEDQWDRDDEMYSDEDDDERDEGGDAMEGGDAIEGGDAMEGGDAIEGGDAMEGGDRGEENDASSDEEDDENDGSRFWRYVNRNDEEEDADEMYFSDDDDMDG